MNVGGTIEDTISDLKRVRRGEVGRTLPFTTMDLTTDDDLTSASRQFHHVHHVVVDKSQDGNEDTRRLGILKELRAVIQEQLKDVEDEVRKADLKQKDAGLLEKQSRLLNKMLSADNYWESFDV